MECMGVNPEGNRQKASSNNVKSQHKEKTFITSTKGPVEADGCSFDPRTLPDYDWASLGSSVKSSFRRPFRDPS